MKLTITDYDQLVDLVESHLKKYYCEICKFRTYHLASGFKDYNLRWGCLRCEKNLS